MTVVEYTLKEENTNFDSFLYFCIAHLSFGIQGLRTLPDFVSGNFANALRVLETQYA